MTEYVTIKLPEEVAKQIDKLIGKHGFDSRADVVKDALRQFFEKHPETKTITAQEA